MLKVLFFARLREQLACERLELAFEGPLTPEALREQLAAERGEDWREALFADKTLVAVNRDFARFDTRLADGDEVAFYPPVTGG